MGDKKSKRSQGWEWKLAAWAARHPGFVAVPGAIGAGMIELGPTATGGIVGGIAAGVGAWYRGHPDTFDRWAAPRIRAFRRRWLSKAYLGGWWLDTVTACDLRTVDRKTGEPLFPRVIRVRSFSPSTETVFIKILPGQNLRLWQDQSDNLAVALKAERVAVEKVRPQVFALIVQRSEPFGDIIVPPEVPTDADTVDLSSVYLGETEFGTDWCEPLLGQHILTAGASGSGKNSVTNMFLLACAPLIRDGLVRLTTINPKATESAKLKPMSYRYAETESDIIDVIPDYWEGMQERKRTLAAQGKRSFSMSRETPLELLYIDELGAVTGYGSRDLKQAVQQPLALTLSQARALGGTVLGALQEPGKDVLPHRDLFTLRVQMRAQSSLHPDMTLGEDMRKRGALADEIPNVPDTAGIGYMVRQRTRTPVKIRAAYPNDDDIDQMVRIATWPTSELSGTKTTEEVNDNAEHE